MRAPINKICEAMGIEVYDTSLPQDYFTEINSIWNKLTGRTDNVYGHVVWSYDVFAGGAPVAVDELGMRMMAVFYENKGTDW